MALTFQLLGWEYFLTTIIHRNLHISLKKYFKLYFTLNKWNRNVAEPVYPSSFGRPVTNNQAEIKAVIETFYILRKKGII